MKRVVLFAAALAAGLSSFAATAANSDRAPAMVKVAAEPAREIKKAKVAKVSKAEPAKKLKKAKVARTAKANKNAKVAKASVKLGKSGASAISAKRVKMTIDPRKPQKKSRKSRPNVDMTETGSIPAKGNGRAYSAIVSRYAATYGVPASLAHAVIRVESNYRANARGAAGEIGLMQIKPATARMMGYSGSAQGLFNPETNIKYGVKYLAKAHQLGGGNTCGTILRYNAGHGAKRMNPVSAAYCSKVKRDLAS